jgi:hypothetical protein
MSLSGHSTGFLNAKFLKADQKKENLLKKYASKITK